MCSSVILTGKIIPRVDTTPDKTWQSGAAKYQGFCIYDLTPVIDSFLKFTIYQSITMKLFTSLIFAVAATIAIADGNSPADNDQSPSEYSQHKCSRTLGPCQTSGHML
ncbi:hypothetical protein HRG_014755 [Hirsutella rhossiliensis]